MMGQFIVIDTITSTPPPPNSVVQQTATSIDITIAPNSATGHQVQVYFSQPIPTDSEISILNQHGQLVDYQDTYRNIETGSRQCSLDVSVLSPGLYFIRIQSADAQYLKKLIKL